MEIYIMRGNKNEYLKELKEVLIKEGRLITLDGYDRAVFWG